VPKLDARQSCKLREWRARDSLGSEARNAMVLKVSAIGSCRVYAPLQCAKDRRLIELGHDGVEWLTHSSRDVLQKVAIVNREKTLTKEHVALLISEVRKFRPEVHRSGFYRDTEVFVIEICSIKLIQLGELYLQQWCVKAALEEEASSRVRQLAEQARTTLMTENDIRADLLSIHARLKKPIVFVLHNLLKKDDGTIPKERLIIRRAFKAAASEIPGFTSFDPTDAILEYGPAKAMKDRAHYTPAFDDFLGTKMAVACEAAVSSYQSALVSA
jgi:hypothetical protein